MPAMNHDTGNIYLRKFEIFIELRYCIYCKMIEYLMSRISEHFWKFEVILSKKSNYRESESGNLITCLMQHN